MSRKSKLWLLVGGILLMVGIAIGVRVTGKVADGPELPTEEAVPLPDETPAPEEEAPPSDALPPAEDGLPPDLPPGDYDGSGDEGFEGFEGGPGDEVLPDEFNDEQPEPI